MNADVRRAIGSAALVIGLLLLAIGLFLGFGGITKNGEACGSAYRPANEYSVSNDCQDATSNRKPIAWALTAPGAALTFIGGVILLADAQSRRESVASAS